MPTITEETVQKAGQELGDILNLALDNKNNRDQVAEFMSHGMEAFFAVSAVGIPATQRAAFAFHLLLAVAERAKVSFPLSLSPVPPVPTPVP